MDRRVEDRQRLKSQYGHLYDEVMAILQEHDPIGIAVIADFIANDTEYDPELGSILPRLKEANSVGELRRIIYEEFVLWFSSSEAKSWEERLTDNSAGSEEAYEGIAQDIWQAWQRWLIEAAKS